MLFALAAAPLLAAGAMSVAGVPVDVAASSRFGHYLMLSVPVSAGPPEQLQRVLLQAAAKRTLADGRRAFTTSVRFTAPSTEARLEQARQSIHTSPDGVRYMLALQELPASAAEGADGQKIDAVQTLRILGDS